MSEPHSIESRMVAMIDAVLEQLRQPGRHPPPDDVATSRDEPPWQAAAETDTLAVINADD